jgi:hypothetical protein
MKIITYDQEQNKITEGFYSAIREILKISAPDYVLSIEKAGDEFNAALSAWDGKACLLSLIMDFYPDTTSTRFLLSTPSGSKFEKYCIREAGHAAWGCCLSNAVAINYAPKKNSLVTQVHEFLHLLGVEECYEGAIRGHPPKSSCNNERCVMRYGSSSTEVCSSVIKQITSNVG